MSANHSLLAESSILLFALAIVFLSDRFTLYILWPAPQVSFSIFVSTKILLLLFNGQILYTFSNILKNICCDDPYVSYDVYHIYCDTILFSTHFRMTYFYVRQPLVWVEAYIFPHSCI